ncbi:ribosome hibernation-promoting factor, HPF/YfiA family [Chryseobacterium sp. SC28]|uniref:ribosome hibernation-promoting factor, HPF/YfiA family n=1 Tax=Chryseobacterium sp. SC28 TaxID=2268028 RepID=UPI000F64BAC3|nr:ribosome-associated translation inhibitor RaiA [Chryseobacterium sp. SC28]RRQ45385.1 ribosome-associated translation inhibitor RaiA [Chryseobacterium sp. SC28]
MKITIQSVGVTPHEPLKERIEKKLSKLETFYDKIVEIAVYLKVENTSEKENKTTELVVKVPGDDIVVKKTCATFEESLDECFDTAKKLLIKKKELAL